MITIVGERAAWAEQLAQVKRMRQWVLDAEHILDESWAKPGECVSNEQVGRRLDRWRKTVGRCLADPTLSPVEQECLGQFLQVLSNLRARNLATHPLQIRAVRLTDRRRRCLCEERRSYPIFSIANQLWVSQWCSHWESAARG